jgi:hypothetical protein
MKLSFRFALPIVMGAISAVLMAWDIHNQRIIMSMGMAWDTGAPLWPYQTPDTFLFAINAPAYLIANPISRLLALLVPRHYYVLFPAILLWWWLVGSYLDKRCAGTKEQKAPIKALFLYLLAASLIFLGLDGFIHATRWWWSYSRNVLSVTDLILLRILAPSIWCFALSVVVLAAAWQRTRIWTARST